MGRFRISLWFTLSHHFYTLDRGDNFYYLGIMIYEVQCKSMVREVYM